ncbi:hypothetical protein PGB90_006106 [Kerria lacca]
MVIEDKILQKTLKKNKQNVRNKIIEPIINEKFENQKWPEKISKKHLIWNDEGNNNKNNLPRSEAILQESPNIPMKMKKIKHIHPCICDLTSIQRKRISDHDRKIHLAKRKYEKRIKEVETELTLAKEAQLEKERELREQQELFGDEYEMVGTKKKRKKRSARRASMVSLGVKQVINWRKEPRIKVKMSRSSTLRMQHSSHCGKNPFEMSPIRKVHFEESPKIPVRMTRTFSLRIDFDQQRKQGASIKINRKPSFVIPSLY